MKKRIITFIIAFLMILPIPVNAEVETMNLEDTLESESINPVYSNYEETDEQITLYLFRGQGCSHCEELLKFINTIVDEYGYMFKLRSYECWGNTDNAALKDKIVKFLNVDAEGYPFLVIGENTFYGFSEDNEENIIKAIKDTYNSAEPYDVLEVYNKKLNSKSDNDALVLIIPVLIVLIVYFLFKSAKSDIQDVPVIEEKKTEVKQEKQEKKSEIEIKPTNTKSKKNNSKPKKKNNKKK